MVNLVSDVTNLVFFFFVYTRYLVTARDASQDVHTLLCSDGDLSLQRKRRCSGAISSLLGNSSRKFTDQKIVV